MPSYQTELRRDPLLRLLTINLGIGVAQAVLMFAGLFALNPQNLRGLILADRSPALAVGLLLFGLIITFGSMAMGSGIMMISHHDKSGCGSLPIRAPTDVTCEPLASKSEMSNRSLRTEESVLHIGDHFQASA